MGATVVHILKGWIQIDSTLYRIALISEGWLEYASKHLYFIWLSKTRLPSTQRYHLGYNVIVHNQDLCLVQQQ